MSNSRKNTLGIGLFALGFFVAIVFAGAGVWADVEGAMFDAALIREGERLRTVHCPMIMTTGETATVRASFTNPAEREVTLPVRARISDGFVTLIREVRDELTLAPGASGTVSWTVRPGDAAYERFVLVRVHQLRVAPHPYRQGTCGILVVDLPFLSGGQLVWLLALGSLGAMLMGMALWQSGNGARAEAGAEGVVIMSVLLVSAGLALLAAAIGWWGMGLGVLGFTALCLTGAIGYLINQH